MLILELGCLPGDVNTVWMPESEADSMLMGSPSFPIDNGTARDLGNDSSYGTDANDDDFGNANTLPTQNELEAMEVEALVLGTEWAETDALPRPNHETTGETIMWKKNLLNTACAAVLCLASFGRANAAEDWSTTYNGDSNLSDEPATLLIDDNLSTYVPGASEDSAGGSNGLLLKYDASGTLSWADQHDASAGDEDMWLDAVSDGNGGVYVTGFGTGSDGTDLATARYDADGNQTWLATHDEAGDTNEEGTHILTLSDGSVVSVGLVISTTGTQSVLVTRHAAADGSTLSTSTWSTGVNFTTRLQDASRVDDDILIAGVRGNDGDITGSSNDVFVARLQSDGTEVWSYTYDSGDGDGASRVVADDSGNVYVAGQSGLTTAAITLVRLLADGSEDWVASFTGDDLDTVSRGLAVDPTGNAIVTGYKTTEESIDFVTLKYSAAGSLLWEQGYDGASSGTDIASDVAVDAFGDIFVTGSADDFEGSGSRGIATLKYDSDGNESWFELFEVADTNSVVEAVSLDYDAVGRVVVGGAIYPDSTESFNIAVLAYGEVAADADEVGLPHNLPTHLELGQNFPNPARFGTTVRYALPRSGQVRISLFDAGGRLLSVALDEYKEAGFYQSPLPVDGLAGGVYFYRLDWENERRTRKLTISR